MYFWIYEGASKIVLFFCLKVLSQNVKFHLKFNFHNMTDLEKFSNLKYKRELQTKNLCHWISDMTDTTEEEVFK